MLTPEQRSIVENNIGLAYAFVRRAKNAGYTLYSARMDDDDMLSVACLALCKAAEIFDNELGYRFSTVFYRVCQNEFKKILRHVSDIKHGGYYSSLYLDCEIKDSDGICLFETLQDDSTDIEERYLARLEVAVLHDAIDSLDESLRSYVCMHHLCNISQPDISQAACVSQSTVSRKLRQAYQKLALHMTNNGFIP